MKNFFKENWRRIILAIAGLILTIIAFTLHFQINKTWLIVVISICCFLLGSTQMYNLYIKQKEFDILSSLIITFFASFVFIVVVFAIIVLVCMVSLKEPFSFVFLLYALYLYPSFVIVILIIMLLLMMLSYA